MAIVCVWEDENKKTIIITIIITLTHNLLSTPVSDSTTISLPAAPAKPKLTAAPPVPAMVVTEGGANLEIPVVLDAHPGRTVDLVLYSDDGGTQLNLLTTWLRFDGATYSNAQTVTLSAVDDQIMESTKTANIYVECGSGTGRDGAFTVTTATVPFLETNKYFGVTSVTAVTKRVDLVGGSDVTALTAGDEVMLWQTQDGFGDKHGQWESNYIDSCSALPTPFCILTLAFENAYTSGIWDAAPSRVTQMVRVPHFSDMTLNSGAVLSPPSWDGVKGGVLMFRVSGTLKFLGTSKIDARGRGFRGGKCGTCGNSAWGTQGEGYTGIGGESISCVLGWVFFFCLFFLFCFVVVFLFFVFCCCFFTRVLTGLQKKKSTKN
jgi:hypothetical protein